MNSRMIELQKEIVSATTEAKFLVAEMETDEAKRNAENREKLDGILASAGILKAELKTLQDVEALDNFVFTSKTASSGSSNDLGIDADASNHKKDALAVYTPGESLIETTEYKNSFSPQGLRTKSRVQVEAELKKVLGFRPSARKATFDIATAGVTNYDRLPAMVLIDVQRLTVADLLASGQTAANTIRYLKEVFHTNAATAVAEGALKPEASFDTVEVDAPVKKIAVTAKVTDELFADFPAMRDYIDNRLRFMAQQTEEAQLLNGTGVGANITGILQTAGIQTQALATDTKPDAIHKAITKIRSTGFLEPDGMVIHPSDWEELRLLKDANNQYYGGGPFTGAYGIGAIAPNSFWGLPTVVTTAITVGTALVGAFRTAAQVFFREGITVEATNSNEDDFKKNLIAIRVEERLALAVYRPLGFCTVTGI